MTQQLLINYQSQYFDWQLTRRGVGDSLESLASALVDTQVDFNPHQVEAALFSCSNPLSLGVILADEVGLDKAIEAGLVISQRWVDRHRCILVVVADRLRKQWHQEFQDKFNLQRMVVEAKNNTAIHKQGNQTPFFMTMGPVICSYKFAKAKSNHIKGLEWDLVVLDEAGFDLNNLPQGFQADRLGELNLGRYELPLRCGEALICSIGHPLAVWVTDRAKVRTLHPVKLVFYYGSYGKKKSTLEPYRGKSGWLTLKLISIEALGNQEKHLLVSPCTSDGPALNVDDPEKQLSLTASIFFEGTDVSHSKLNFDSDVRKENVLREINLGNLGYFEQEGQKFDAWADDLKMGLEQELKAIDAEIKEVRKTVAVSPTLEEKLAHKRQQRALEAKPSKLRRDLFAGYDEVKTQRNHLIIELEVQLQQQVEQKKFFTIEWDLR